MPPRIREVDSRNVVKFVKLADKPEPEEALTVKIFYSVMVAIAIALGTMIVIGLY